MDEKTIQRIKKLQALAERGVGGEKTTAQKKLAKLLKDNGINSLDELQKEEYEYTIFSYNGKHEIKLLRQCMYKVMGAKSDRTAFMSIELDDLQAKLEKDGWTSEYQNGQNQWGTKKSPEAETYIALSKNYAAVIKQLTELVPAAKRKTSRLAALREE